MFVKALKTTVVLIERAITFVLVVLVALALVGLGGAIVHSLGEQPLLGPEQVTHLIDHVMVVFVLIELFAIALAYVQGRRVIRTVLEAALVAAARKVIAFEPGADALQRGVALSAVVLAIAATWFLMHRIGATNEPSPERED